MSEPESAAGDIEALTLGPLRQRLLSGGIWALAGRIGSAGLGIAVSALLARVLVPEDVGTFFLALSVVTVASLLARAGLDKTVLALVANRLGIHDQLGARKIVIRVLGLAAGSILLTGAVLSVFGAEWLASQVFTSRRLAAIAALSGPWVFVVAFDILLAETFRGFHDIARASLFGGFVARALTTTVLVGLLLVSGQAALSTVVIISIASGGVSLVVGLFELKKTLTRLRGGEGRAEHVSSILRTSWPLLVANITLYAVSQADIWIIGAFRTEQEVAVYAVAARLVLLVGMSLTVVNAVLPPVIGELYAQRQNEKLERVIRSTTTLAAIPSTLVLILFILFGGPILRFAFGPYYTAGTTVLALLSFGQLMNVFVGSCGFVLVMTRHQSDLMISSIIAGSVSVFGGLATVGRWGTTGVAAAVMAGVILQQLMMLALARRRVGIWTHASPRLVGPTLTQAYAAVRSLAGAHGTQD